MNTRILFILGFPRSGTKLLMQLLKSHSNIHGFDVEVNMAIDFAKIVNADKNDLLDLYKKNTISINLPRLEESIESLPRDVQTENCYTRFLCLSAEKIVSKDLIYVLDKSPRYTSYLSTLIKSYPNARFIHIYRNVTEVADSFLRTWNKNPYRTSNQWKQVMNNMIYQKSSLKVENNLLLEINYSDLTNNPEVVMRKIALFLNISPNFNFNVISNEKYGRTRGIGIRKNEGIITLSNNQLKRIEEISFNQLKHYEIIPSIALSEIPLNTFHRYLFKLQDEYNLLRFHLTEKGIWKGLIYYKKLKF